MSKPAPDDSLNSFDCDSADEDHSFRKPAPQPLLHAPNSTISGTNKCQTPYLSADGNARGSDGFARQPCFNLICRRCDVYVKHYTGKRWTNDVDYMFFRSNFGDSSKLEPKLADYKGSIAFHCGCSGISVQSPRPANGDSGLKWICYGHE